MSSLVFELDELACTYRRQPAWHNLGLTIDDPTMAMVRDRIGFHVDKEPTYAPDGRGGFRPTQWSHTVRTDLDGTDSRRILGVVGSRYTVLQNSELCDSAEILAGEGGFIPESAGTLDNGRLTWLLGKLPGVTDVAGDKLGQYLLLANSHDGSGAFKIGFTPIRVVCWNTLSLAAGTSDAQARRAGFVTIRHTESAPEKVKIARRTLGLAKDYFEDTANKFRKLAESPLHPDVARAIMRTIFPDPKAPANPARAQNARGDVIRLYQGAQPGGKQSGVHGTAWGLFNAVQDYRQYSYGSAPTSDQRATRLESTWFGSRAAARKADLDTIMSAIDFEDTARADQAEALLSQVELN